MASPKTSTQAVTELDRIYNDPDTAPALDLFQRFATNSLNEKGFKEFLDTLPAEAAQERAKLEQLLANPGARVDADLSTRAGQMVWAAGLGFVSKNSPPDTIRNHAVWKTLTRNPRLSESLGSAARYLDLSLTNRNATMDWGTPGSWFWFAPDKNHINIDLFHTLLLGFDKSPVLGMKGFAHATGVMLHEVGHSQLTTRFTDAMIALREQEAKLMAESKLRKLTRDEYKQLKRITMEFKLRMNVMNATEDNCVNRYAANQGREFPHDFGASLNICNVILQGSGHYLKTHENKEGEHSDFAKILKDLMTAPHQKEIEKSGQAISNLSKAIMLAFYSTNGLFETRDTETWKKLGINPDEIKGVDGSDFNDLMKTCLGTEGIANLQPAARDRWLLRSVFARSVESYADRRCTLIEQIWDKYAAPYAKVLIDAAEENAENKMNQKQQQSKDKKDGQEQEGQNQSGEGSDSQQKQQGKDDASSSQDSGGGQPGGEEQEGDGSGSVEVEGVGQMDVDGSLPSTPQESQKKERQQQGEQDINQDNAKTVRDLAHEAKQKARKDAEPQEGKDGQGKSKPEAPPADLDMGGGSGPSGVRKVDLTKLSEGDWKEFRKRMNELEPVVSRVSDDFVYIRDRQKQFVREISKQKEQLPRGGDLRQRLDMRAHINLAAKRATGQKIEDIDLQKWKKDDLATETTSVELWIMGDGSGSTRQSLADGGRRIDSCLQTMAILHEAGKRANFDVYAGVWENHYLRMLAEPGTPEKKIGENFDAVKKSGGVGTIYNTPLPGIIERLSKQTTDAQGRPKRFAGMTHFLWVVDGTANDLDVQGTAAMLTKLFRYGPSVSVDIAYMGGYSDCETKQIVELVKKAVPGAQIDTLEAMNAKDAPVLLARKIKARFEKSAKIIKAVPDSQKREAFSSAYKAMRR